MRDAPNLSAIEPWERLPIAAPSVQARWATVRGTMARVQRPALVGHEGQGHRCARATGALAAPPAPDRQPFVAVEPIQLLRVHQHAPALQQQPDAPIAETFGARRRFPASLCGSPDCRAAARAAPSSDRRPVRTQARRPRDVMVSHRPQHRVPPRVRCRQASAMVLGPVASHGFDPRRSFSTTLSSMASARSRFSLPFSFGAVRLSPAPSASGHRTRPCRHTWP